MGKEKKKNTGFKIWSLGMGFMLFGFAVTLLLDFQTLGFWLMGLGGGIQIGSTWWRE